MNLQNIFNDCALTVTRYESVQGGDINQCYCLYAPGKKYFLKVNDAGLYAGMFVKEAKGLVALQENGKLSIPAVIKNGITGHQQYLLLEWLEPGNPIPGTWESFGAGLAQLHKQTQTTFGWNENNFIGSLTQINSFHNSWEDFYATCRILPLVGQLRDSDIYSKYDLRNAESLCKKLGQLFPREPPALLHGDLWNGNFMITKQGETALFDPAVYYGHREMDIGMTRLFGGFDPRFYQKYQECYPLEPAWEQRLPLTQLYPLLVHAVLFGGSYIGRCSEILRTFGG